MALTFWMRVHCTGLGGGRVRRASFQILSPSGVRTKDTFACHKYPSLALLLAAL
jgi:hypothetical protein